MFSAEARWERIARFCFWIGCLFGVFTANALVVERDDWRGVVMTAAPGAIMFALWYLARARAEYLLSAASPPRALAIASTVVIAAGFCALVYHWSHPRVIYVDDRTTLERIQGMDLSDLETVEVETELANGHKAMIKTLRRKR